MCSVDKDDSLNAYESQCKPNPVSVDGSLGAKLALHR